MGRFKTKLGALFTTVLVTLGLMGAGPPGRKHAPPSGNHMNDAVNPEKKLVFLHDTIHAVTEEAGKIKVAFGQHAAVYAVDPSTPEGKGIVAAARAALKDGKPRHISVRFDRRAITRIDLTPDPDRPAGKPKADG